MKTHIALTTTRFDAAVDFYRTLFGVEPVKHKPGYAKFDVDDPGLNLTLNAGTSVCREQRDGRGTLNHLGLQVDDAEVVQAAARRLVEAGLATRMEDDVECCYARQDKVWVHDPDGNAWEVFSVHVEDTAPELGPDGPKPTEVCCA